jgi:hypothetical protein
MSEGIDAWFEALEQHEEDLGELDDIEGPSKIPLDNLAIQILGSMLVGNRQLVLLGELIAEYHQFQMGAEAKCRHETTPPNALAGSVTAIPAKSVAAYFSVYEHVLAVHRTWRAYLTASATGGHKVSAAREEFAAFDRSLAAAVAFMREDGASENHLPAVPGD